MALFGTTARALRTEVSNRIMDLVPSNKSTRRFKRYEEKSAQKKPINEFTGTSRMFYIGAAKEVQQTYYGNTITNATYEIPITFVYRRTTTWSDAAIDDMEQVRYDMMNTSGAHGVTGIANRHIDPNTQVIIEPHAEDKWDYYTLRLLAWFEMDHS